MHANIRGRKMLFGIVLTILASCQAYNFSSHANYLTNDELYSFMRESNRNYPTMTHLYSIGKSIKGTELMVIALSSRSPDQHLLLRPETKYIGNIHGNEIVSREILVRFIDHMLTNYGTDANVTFLMDNSRIHVMPTMNPDGFDMLGPRDCTGVVGRYNQADVDLNRDFPDTFQAGYRTKDMMQPESVAVIDWMERQQFVLSANFHGGSTVVNYPYDSTLHPTAWDSLGRPSISADDSTFQYVSRKYSFNHLTIRQSRCPYFKDGITNGAKWYIAQGTMQDYNYVKAGCMEVTIELGCCKHPSYDTIENHWINNRLALTEYLKQVDLGVKGVITKQDGTPLGNAEIQIDDTMVVKTTPLGEYWKIVLPGNHTLKVTQDGQELAIKDIETVSEKATVYNITITTMLSTSSSMVVRDGVSPTPNTGVVSSLSVYLMCFIFIDCIMHQLFT